MADPFIFRWNISRCVVGVTTPFLTYFSFYTPTTYVDHTAAACCGYIHIMNLLQENTHTHTERSTPITAKKTQLYSQYHSHRQPSSLVFFRSTSAWNFRSPWSESVRAAVRCPTCPSGSGCQGRLGTMSRKHQPYLQHPPAIATPFGLYLQSLNQCLCDQTGAVLKPQNVSKCQIVIPLRWYQ
jgi:hypothetical protein